MTQKKEEYTKEQNELQSKFDKEQEDLRISQARFKIDQEKISNLTNEKNVLQSKLSCEVEELKRTTEDTSTELNAKLSKAQEQLRISEDTKLRLE